MIVIEVKKESANESNLSIIKRFSRRVQSSGVIRQLKSKRYAARPKSDFKRKRETLKRIGRRAEIEYLRKLGKLPDVQHQKPH
ncbi:MAG TPA: hypothetical protein VJB69_00205 [Candidatus Paceibacterota bacterium]